MKAIFVIVFAAFAVAALAAGWGYYVFGGPRERKRARICQENLAKIDGAKEQWGLLDHPGNRFYPTRNDLAWDDGMGYLKSFPTCPSGGEYLVGGLGETPRCMSGLPGHVIVIETPIPRTEGAPAR